MKPLVKWVGGKARLASSIAEHVPMAFTEYHEPFAGGAALFCELVNGEDLDACSRVSLGDTNPDLMALYRMVQDARGVEKFKAAMWVYREQYENADPSGREKLYYESRDHWNGGGKGRDPARFVFLKQTAFNGLWRVNKKGELNASWGKYKTIGLPDDDNLDEWHQALQYVDLRTGPYHELVVDAGAVIYVDPPYYGTFDGYTPEGFTHADHVALLCQIWKWQNAGATVIYSNSMHEQLMPLVDLIWPDAQIQTLTTKYVVNTDGQGRTDVQEMLAVG